MNDKTEFYWAIIGDANPEPVAVTTENDKRVAYTIGCPDPFDLESGNIELIPASPSAWTGTAMMSAEAPMPLTIPMKPLERQLEREEAERRLAAERKKGVVHGWRRFNP